MIRVIRYIVAGYFMVMVITSCSDQLPVRPFNNDSRPYTRYWWFASTIKENDVRYNLNWLKENGFGGVELAWVYPLNRFNPKDTSYTPRQEWLSPDWTKIVDYTVRYADSIGLGCDLTLGTLWPFGDSYVPFNQATQRYGDPGWRQEITRSWQHPVSGYVVDHLTPENYLPYFKRIIKAFPQPKAPGSQAYFIDSWEVETERLWSDSFKNDFLRKFNYDISPFMDSIYEPANSSHLYDYMSLVSEKVLKFYYNFDSTLNSAGVLSRGQVSGAPCDLISGYALMDIPEGESMLFEPEFCTIPASAALLSKKNVVSSETFTCLYGWPADYMREEQTADLKLVADALFGNGINHIIWHGKPHNPEGYDTVNFYATTHVGPESAMADEIPLFNEYLIKVSSYMKKGSTYSDIAVYLPTEDAWTAGRMPVEKQFIWAWGYYEMRYVYFPPELEGFNPVWINGEFLEKASVNDGNLIAGNARCKALYIDAEYLDYKVVKRLADLAKDGLQIILKRDPREPGTYASPDYHGLIETIKRSENVSDHMSGNLTPFISGEKIPSHWCRKEGDDLYVFFPNPKARRLKFPLEYGQSLCEENDTMAVTINYNGKEYEVSLVFKPYQSLLYKIDKNNISNIDISFIPSKPSVKQRAPGYKAPWLVY
jgi:hypothetical protein